MMREALVLFVEGKRARNEALKSSLARKGYQLQVYNTGGQALDWAEEYEPDLVIVDASSMRTSGIRITSRLRKLLGDIPIIHCRAQGRAENRNAQADVYLAQPFTSRKLLNRIKSLIPADDLKEEIVRAGSLTLYRSKRSVDVEGKGEQRLTPKLASLLEEFLRYPNQVLERERLMRKIWKTSYFGDTRTLDVHIRWVREIIEVDPAKPKLLRTVRGVGYIFSIPKR
jgi:DNA-binding response OmpR family regulator